MSKEYSIISTKLFLFHSTNLLQIPRSSVYKKFRRKIVIDRRHFLYADFLARIKHFKN